MSSNPEIKQLLNSMRAAMLGDRMAHAYLIAGRSRAVLRVAAGEILALLYCGAALKDRPCRQCAACRQALDGAHPDTLWVEPESKSRAILLDQINLLRRHMARTTFDGGWKTAVLVDAERMNTEAANTILKTLEEPPPRSLFLLLTESPGEILATIASRCQRLTVNTADLEESRAVREIIRQVMTGVPGAGVAAALSRSAMLLAWLKQVKSEITAEEESGIPDETMENLDRPAREEMEKRIEARVEARYRGRRQTVLEWLMLWQRDLLLSGYGAADAMLAYRDDAAAVRQAAGAVSCRRALANLRVLEDMATQLARNLYENMVFAQGFINLELN